MLTIGLQVYKISACACIQLHCDGADGWKPMSRHAAGAGPREDLVPSLSDAVWHQTSPFCQTHPQGNEIYPL